MAKHCFIYTVIDYTEALNLFSAYNDRYNDVQNMLLSISQLQEDRQYMRKFLTPNTNSSSDAYFEYINNSITKTMKNVFLSVISSITGAILSGIMTVLLFLSLFWSVVSTTFAFRYFIPIGIAKIRDEKPMLGVKESLLQNLYQRMTSNYNIFST